jgi:thiamine-phosphate pyrophosphorylase
MSKFMLPDLTPAVERAVAAARELAQATGAREVQPLHLLHGLLAEEEGRAATLLREAGADPVAAHTMLADLAARPAGETSRHIGPLLEEARELAGELYLERTVASDALLLILLREDPELRRSLEALGMAFARLESAVLALRKPLIQLDEPLRLVEPAEQVDTSRVLDAAANRAREALRVVEDYCRFALDDAFLSGELKRLRHDLAAALAALSSSHLLEARETLRDVGTALSTDSEARRYSLREVALVNLKRLQEALRTLEEFGKLHELGRAVEALRYRSYTLERALLLGADARQRLAGVRLCVLLTRARCAAALDWTIQEAAAGGATMFQLREKERPDRELLQMARDVRRWTLRAAALFIVNDRPDIARLVEADGVHLGQGDLPVKEARRVLGPDALVGVSTHTVEQLRQAVLDGASYVGVGPTFASGTKDFAELAGLDFVRQAAVETSLPAFVIGGVSPRTVAAAAAAGARRIAVSQAVCEADDPQAAAAELLLALPSLAGPGSSS